MYLQKLFYIKKASVIKKVYLTLSLRWSLSYRNYSIDSLFKLMDWFLYDRDLRHDRIKAYPFQANIPLLSHQRFPDVSRANRKGTLAWNELNKNHNLRTLYWAIIISMCVAIK